MSKLWTFYKISLDCIINWGYSSNSNSSSSSNIYIVQTYDSGSDKTTLDLTLVDYYDTTEERLRLANHIPGPKCRCLECEKLKNIEDFWIMKLGTFYDGFNTRDEVKSKSRYNWKWIRRGALYQTTN